MIGEPSIQEMELNNTVDAVLATEEPPPNALDKFMARLEMLDVNGQPLTDLQRQVKGFIIYALSFNQSVPETSDYISPLVRDIRELFSRDHTVGAKYDIADRLHFNAKYCTWPKTAKCIITLNGQDMLLFGDTAWRINDEVLLHVARVSTQPNDQVPPVSQLLIILALGGAFGVMDQELYIDANKMLGLVRPGVLITNSRLRNMRLAIDRDGLQIAAYHKDGYYSPNGEPVNVSVGPGSAQWTTVQL